MSRAQSGCTARGARVETLTALPRGQARDLRLGYAADGCGLA